MLDSEERVPSRGSQGGDAGVCKSSGFVRVCTCPSRKERCRAVHHIRERSILMMEISARLALTFISGDPCFTSVMRFKTTSGQSSRANSTATERFSI